MICTRLPPWGLATHYQVQQLTGRQQVLDTLVLMRSTRGRVARRGIIRRSKSQHQPAEAHRNQRLLGWHNQ